MEMQVLVLDFCSPMILGRMCVAGKNKIYLGIHIQFPMFVSDCKKKKKELKFLKRFSLKSPIVSFTKIRPGEAESIHANGRTDRKT